MVKLRRHKARDFGDNPHIRGGKDRAEINPAEPWERKHVGIKKAVSRVRSHTRIVHGKRQRVKSHLRRN